MSVGLQALRAACIANDPGFIRRIDPDLLIDTEEVIYRAILEHIRRHRVMPTVATLAEQGYVLQVEAAEPLDYYLARVRDRAVYRAMQTRVGRLSDTMRAGNVSEAADIAREMARAVTISEQHEDLSTARQHFQTLSASLTARGLVPGEVTGMTTGWSFVDRLSGGMHGGDLVTLAGRTGMGKSMLLLWMAYRLWVSGASILFYSMEMEASVMARRLAGIMTGTNPRLLQRGAVSEYARDHVLMTLDSAREYRPFNIVDGSFRKGTADVEARAGELNPDVIFVDASYLMRPDGTARNVKRWERLSDVAEQLKAIAMSHKKPLVQSVQFNREMPDNRKKKDPDTGFISGSDTIGQISSIILAIMKGAGDFPETRREMRILKDREGGSGKFHINFKFDPVDFSEISGSGIVAGDNESEEASAPGRDANSVEESMR